MKILFLDIETAPNVAHVWGLWQQNVGINQLLDSSYTLCWAAKWYGESGVEFMSVYEHGPKRMVKRIHALLCEADAVVHYNGTKFDIPTLNKEFLMHGLTPPRPYDQIDLLKVARNQFRFPSNKLDYVAKTLGLKGKVRTKGHELWIQCMADDAEAWVQMKKYNIGDVYLLEDVYERLIPWIKNHPNWNMYTDKDRPICPKCSSHRVTYQGFRRTKVAKYRQYKCKDCGGWSRSRVSEKADKTGVLVNV